MTRPLRIGYPGAPYYVISRGDRREDIVETDADRVLFLDVFGHVVERYAAMQDLTLRFPMQDLTLRFPLKT